jgi:hypothetical protein|tara:strand:- start:86 stop:556 length:471 start_codon:yes stop_codon:yes gene_type:complete
MDTYIISGKAYWASVIAPNTTYEPCWQVNVCLDEDGKNLAESLGLDVKNKGDEKGDFIKVKRKVDKRDGTKQTAPIVKDSNNNDWDDRLIGNGSLVNVKFSTFDYNYNNKKGVAAFLLAVQVVDLVPYGGGGLEFEPVKDGFVVGGGSEAAQDVPF